MTQRKDKADGVKWKELIGDQQDFLRPLVGEVIQQVLEAEIQEAVGAGKGDRNGKVVWEVTGLSDVSKRCASPMEIPWWPVELRSASSKLLLRARLSGSYHPKTCLS